MTSGDAQIRDHKVRVLLSCGCERIFNKTHAPSVGDVMLCLRHGEVVVKSFQYNWKCITCGTHKFYGHARINCEVYASRHALKYQGHIIKLFNLSNKEYMTMGKEKEEVAGFGF